MAELRKCQVRFPCLKGAQWDERPVVRRHVAYAQRIFETANSLRSVQVGKRDLAQGDRVLVFRVITLEGTFVMPSVARLGVATWAVRDILFVIQQVVFAPGFCPRCNRGQWWWWYITIRRLRGILKLPLRIGGRRIILQGYRLRD